jgi:hypothetical protein
MSEDPLSLEKQHLAGLLAIVSSCRRSIEFAL